LHWQRQRIAYAIATARRGVLQKKKKIIKQQQRIANASIFMETPGFEPETFSLKVRHSTTRVLLPNNLSAVTLLLINYLSYISN
jgi:hypothetical protein